MKISNVKIKIMVLLLFLVIIISIEVKSILLAPFFNDTTEVDFGQGTLHLTNITGSDVGTNVTLNFTVNTGNMSGGHNLYNITGNFTSRIFDSGHTNSVFDKIAWTSTLPNTSDAIGFAMHTGARDVGVFYRNGSIGTNLNQRAYDASFAFTDSLRFYSIPTGWSRDDIIGFGWDDDNSPNLYALFRNGSIAQSSQADLTTDAVLTSTSSFTILGGFNTSDVIGFAVDTVSNPTQGTSALFFKNGSYLVAPTESPPFAFSTVRAFTLSPSGFNTVDVIGADASNFGNDVAMFFRNGSYVANTATADFSADISFSSVFLATYHSDANITEQTNISLQTRVANDTNFFTDWSSFYIQSNGTQTIEGGNGRYIQYRAVFYTPDKYITPSLENVSLNYSDLKVPDVNSSINNTAPEYGEIINLSANISDFSGLSFCQFIDNQSTDGARRFFNYSIGGQNDRCSQNYTVFTARGSIINFSLIVNDTYNNKNQTDFIIAISGIPPRWQNPEINDTNIEQFDFVKFNATWSDNIQLSGYFFSTNATGKWTNMSNISFSGSQNESNFTMQINASPYAVVGWAFYANDTSNNFNATDVQTFAVVPQYHTFYGDVQSDIVLDTYQNISIIAWFNSSDVKGNVYITDTDTLNGISWGSLQAIGKDKTAALNDVTDDWEDIDTLLGMTLFNDSINRSFINGTRGFPKNKTNFVVQGKLIENVSTINSTNTSNFVTGILWDTSDSADAQYDVLEIEDVVFVTKVNNKALGFYGNYHYEIKIPARLQRYRTPNNQDSATFYVELT
ncbi:hypothetical protein HYY70_04085 [Candidatus Woesearchaeota archaeon]|nr:hypothetical protein [Candidatus Woesearchaeota archaeon]